MKPKLSSKPKEVEETVEESAYLNADEKEVLESTIEEEKKTISIDRLEKVTEVVANTFNLLTGDYVVTSFKDGGSKCTVSLANPEFDITVVIKDTEIHGI